MERDRDLHPSWSLGERFWFDFTVEPSLRRGRAGDGAVRRGHPGHRRLHVTGFHGDVFDSETLRSAMDGVDDDYCVVDTESMAV